MVNIIIYLKKEDSAKELVKFLLLERLIASATIDENNISYKLHNDALYEEVYTVVTAQSKSLLFDQILKMVETKIGEDTPIFSTPIVGSNPIFDNSIRSKTKLI